MEWPKLLTVVSKSISCHVRKLLSPATVVARTLDNSTGNDLPVTVFWRREEGQYNSNEHEI